MIWRTASRYESEKQDLWRRFEVRYAAKTLSVGIARVFMEERKCSWRYRVLGFNVLLVEVRPIYKNK
jgi:hypothetical protein